MIVRIWRGEAALGKAADYERHFTESVVPELQHLAGHRGAYLLKRVADEQVEFLAVTLWELLEAIRAFAGDDPDVAVVEPAAVAALTQFDSVARHYEIVHGSKP